MFCAFVLQKRNIIIIHLLFFFLNDLRDTIFFSLVNKISNIFGPKLVFKCLTLNPLNASVALIDWFLYEGNTGI